MVSNSLHMTEDELIAALGRVKAAHGSDAEYQDLRAGLPADWPL